MSAKRPNRLATRAVTMRTTLALLTAIATVAVGAAVAVAGHQASNVKSYTGCLQPGGTLTAINEGNAPAKPCPSGSVEAHFSGGDITKITAGAGLILGPNGGDNGEVSIALSSAYALPQSCTAGQVAKWNGTGWVCASDSDTNNTYSAGTGLSLVGTQFSIDPEYRVTNDQGCSSGMFATGIDGAGGLTCATPASAQAAGVRIQFTPNYTFSGPDFERIVVTFLPEGTYALFGRAHLQADGFDQDVFWELACELRDGVNPRGGSAIVGFHPDQGTFFTPEQETINVMGSIGVPSGGSVVSLWCKNAGGTRGYLGNYGADLMAVKVGGFF